MNITNIILYPNNKTAAMIENLDDWPMVFQASLVAPEYINFVILLFAVYGMYQGIEIQHPLYAILFLNLIVPLCFTVVDMIGFVFMSCNKYVTLSNTNSGCSIYFHCTSWCLSSIIRYIYIVAPDWIHNVIPNARRQCYITFGVAFLFSVSLSAPVYSYAKYLGKFYVTLNIWQMDNL